MHFLYLFIITLLLASNTLLAEGQCEGPGCGGGTNLYEDELVDFVKFNEKYGDKLYVVNPLRLHQAGDQFRPAYNNVKDRFDRLSYLYPGLGYLVDQAYSKPWLVLDKEFTSRTSKEKKVISQTDDAVFINLKWLTSADQKILEQSILHEGVRSWSTFLINSFFDANVSRDCIHGIAEKIEREQLIKKYADIMTEKLTPLLFKKFPNHFIKKELDAVLVMAREERYKMLHKYRDADPFWSTLSVFSDESCQFDKKYESSFRTFMRPLDRNQIYNALKNTKAKELLLKICKKNWTISEEIKRIRTIQPVNYSTINYLTKSRTDSLLEGLKYVETHESEFFSPSYNDSNCEFAGTEVIAGQNKENGPKEFVGLIRYVGAKIFYSGGCDKEINFNPYFSANERDNESQDYINEKALQGYCGESSKNYLDTVSRFLRELETDKGTLADSPFRSEVKNSILDSMQSDGSVESAK